MRTEDFEAFVSGLSGVHAFYGKDVSPFAADVWWNALKPFDLTAVVDAFNRHLTNPDNGQFLPKPADIIRMLGGRTEDRALVAWAKVDRAVRSVGNYASVVFDDALIHRCISDMGGWVGFGQKTEDEWPFVGKEFQTRYRGYAMRGESPDYLPVLIGISEAYNSRKGLRIEPPKLIGDATKAQAVLSGGNAGQMLSVHDMALRLVSDAA